MSVEGCSSYLDEEIRTDRDVPFVERDWYGRMVNLGGNDIAYLLKKPSIPRSGEMKHQIKPMRRSAGGSAEAKTNSDGESSVQGEVHVDIKDNEGNKISVQAEGTIKNDSDGNVKADASIKVSVEREF